MLAGVQQSPRSRRWRVAQQTDSGRVNEDLAMEKENESTWLKHSG